jgi:phage tail sheath protein FI
MATYTYPGLYVEEIPSGVRTITGVSTSDTAFIDFFPRGPMGEAVRVTGMQAFARTFGGDDPSGLHHESQASYAIKQFFLNGGQVAWVVRVASGEPLAARISLASTTSPTSRLGLAASSPGVWGVAVQVGVDHLVRSASEFNLVAREVRTIQGRPQVVNVEIHRNLSLGSDAPRNVKQVLEAESELVRADDLGGGGRPDATGQGNASNPDIVGKLEFATPSENPFIRLGTNQTKGPSDGLPPTDDTALDQGITALSKIAPNIFNLLCLPWTATLKWDPASPGNLKAILAKATTFCSDKRAFLIVDLPEGVNTSKQVIEFADAIRDRNAAVYFPRVLISDPLDENRARTVGLSGTLAGIYARTDSTRGVWKAPAGIDARLLGATLDEQLTDADNGGLNPFGINVLRTFPIFGNVAWGARTLEGADQQASEWKYIPVRRTALFIEESLFQALKWVVFEPNDEPLWSQIRLNVGAFMNDLFRQGAFQGVTPQQAYFVKCDAETTTQTDIDRGIVNILVGFAPLKPAEFVVIKIQQIAGQIET